MYCTKCGTELLEDATFCQKCGSAIIRITDQTSGSKTTPEYSPVSSQESCADRHRTRKKAMYLIIGGVLIAAIIIVFLLYPDPHGYNTPKEAALAYLAGKYTNAPDLCLSTMHPDLIDEISKSQVQIVCNASNELDNIEYSIDSIETLDVNDGNDTAYFRDAWEHVFNVSLDVTEFATVEFNCSYLEYGTEREETERVILFKSKDRWYSLMDDRIHRYYWEQAFGNLGSNITFP